MPGTLLSSTNPPLGLGFGEKVVRVVNRSGGTRPASDVMQFDILQAQGESTTFGTGGSSSVWTNVIDPNTALDNYAPLCVLLASLGDNEEGLAYLFGNDISVNAEKVGAGASVAGAPAGHPGTNASQTDANALDTPMGLTGKVVAILHESIAASTVAIVKATFDGWHSLGTGA